MENDAIKGFLDWSWQPCHCRLEIYSRYSYIKLGLVVDKRDWNILMKISSESSDAFEDKKLDKKYMYNSNINRMT